MIGNQMVPGSDYNDVDCTRWREAISAEADGERAEIDGRLVAAHVARCPECRSYAESARLLPPRKVPDLADSVSKLHAAADRARHPDLVRVALAAIAVQSIVFAFPLFVLGEEHDAAPHAARHLGAFGVAYGVALLVVVIRPARARSILPMALVLAGAQIIAAIVDLTSGHIPALGEVRHLPQVISVVLIWLLAVPSRRGDGSLARSAPPRLGIVDGRRRAG
jgi:predicted anti-sigma-YlaC factor YlaD